jgi:5-epi-alpha-selinene synthase
MLDASRGFPRYRAAEFVKLLARAHPFCSQRALELANDWGTWLFVWDDFCDRSELASRPDLMRDETTRFLKILDRASVPELTSPLACALHDLRGRMLAMADDAWFSRFSASVRAYFDACIWEASNRHARAVPAHHTYVRMRPHSGAMYTAFDLYTITDELQLPAHVMEHDAIQELRRAAANIICWSNDILSCERELTKGDVHNLVIIIAHHERQPLQRAIYEAAELHNREVQRFIELGRSLPSFSEELDRETQRFVDLLELWISANLSWSLECRRYRPSSNFSVDTCVYRDTSELDEQLGYTHTQQHAAL